MSVVAVVLPARRSLEPVGPLAEPAQAVKLVRLALPVRRASE